MKIISWNVNGIRSISKKGWLEFIASEAPDIFCLQETKASLDQLTPDLIHPLNYNSAFSSATKKGYSGVATFINPALKPNNISTSIGFEKFDQEGRFVISQFNEFTLYNIYFPSGTSGEERQDFKYDFLAVVFDHLVKLSKSELEKVIICGDFNICHKEIDIHHPAQATKLELSGFLPKERAWMDSLVELGFIDTYRHANGTQANDYSWWTYRAGARQKNLGWRIDYFFVHASLASRIASAKIHTNILGSDHAPISLEILPSNY